MGRSDNFNNLAQRFLTNLQRQWPGPSDTSPSVRNLPSATVDVETIIDHAAALTIAKCFKLPTPIWDTITKSGADPRDIAILRNMEYQPVFASPRIGLLGFAIPTILNWLRDLPAETDKVNPPTACSEWTHWWIQMSRQWETRMHPTHPTYHPIIPPEVINQIDDAFIRSAQRIVYAMIAHACSNAPTPIQLARHPAIAPPSTPQPSLREIHDATLTIATIRRQAGLLPIPAPSPEQIAAMMQKHSIHIETDCGSIMSPLQMRQTHGPDNINRMSANPRTLIWHLPRSPAHRPIVDPTPHRINPATIDHDESEIERTLVTNLAPNDPLHSPNIYSALSIAHRITPAHAHAIVHDLKHSTDQPQPCPAVDHCPSACALRQTQQVIPFPTTWTGRYQDCQYYRYLIDRRKTADPQEINALLSAWRSQPRESKMDQPPTKRTTPPRPQPERTQTPLFA